MDDLDISIKFLHAARPDCSGNLYRFLTDTLRFENQSFGEQVKAFIFRERNGNHYVIIAVKIRPMIGMYGL